MIDKQLQAQQTAAERDRPPRTILKASTRERHATHTTNVPELETNFETYVIYIYISEANNNKSLERLFEFDRERIPNAGTVNVVYSNNFEYVKHAKGK